MFRSPIITKLLSTKSTLAKDSHKKKTEILSSQSTRGRYQSPARWYTLYIRDVRAQSVNFACVQRKSRHRADEKDDAFKTHILLQYSRGSRANDRLRGETRFARGGSAAGTRPKQTYNTFPRADAREEKEAVIEVIHKKNL